MAAPSTIQAGMVLSGKYKVGRELGRGGMASVFAADNVDIGKRVAIKLLAGHLTTSQTVVERFLREARAVAKIRSPHICDVYDVGKLDDGTPFLVLELLEGESLYDAMVRDRQMSPQLTLAIILQLCRGLAKAHEVGIVHRDLKPENVFLTVDDDGNLLVKILDFGLAKFYDSPLETPEASTSGKRGKAPPRLTRDGAVFGTPAYMSPEQVRGQAAADTRADLWAVACIAYECFTGTTVWKTDEGVAMTFAQIATAPIPDPRAYRPDLPTSFSTWFQRALDRDIARRPQTVQELADDLVRAFNYSPGAGALDAALVNQITKAARTLNDLDAPTVLVTRKQPARDEQPVPLVRTSNPAPAPTARQADAPPDKTDPTPEEHAKPGPAKVVLAAPSQAAPKAAPLETPSGSSAVALQHPTLVHIELGRSSRRRALGIATLGLGLVAAIAAAVASSVGAPAAVATAQRFGPSLARSASALGSAAAAKPFAPGHPWLGRVLEAQEILAKGDPERAVGALRRLADEVKHPLPKNLLEHAQLAAAAKKSGARCQVTGLGRPRTYDVLQTDRKSVPARSPSIALGLGGALVAWSDASEGSERLTAVALDESLRDVAAPSVVTTDGNKVAEAHLVPVAQRFFSAYSESVGVPGVYTRWLSQAGGSATEASLTSAPKTTVIDVDATRSADGGVVVAWSEEREGGTALAFRAYDKDGQPRAQPVRLAEYRGPSVGRIGHLEIEARGTKLHVAYEVTKGATQEVRLLAVPLDAAAPGVDASAAELPPGEHALAREQLLSRKDELATSPALGCNNEGCYVAWHEPLRGGGTVVYLDRSSSKIQWAKRAGSAGRSFTIGMAPNGQSQLAWYEGGKLVVAGLGLEGPGAETKVAKVSGDPEPAALAPGAQRGEWYATWLDSEAGRPEPYVLRIACP
ncbi:MAG: protein kinase [Deltaproteobacteria bacterium]|nr:protein kinase [Deltaproteobacteria bacterium]